MFVKMDYLKYQQVKLENSKTFMTVLEEKSLRRLVLMLHIFKVRKRQK